MQRQFLKRRLPRGSMLAAALASLGCATLSAPARAQMTTYTLHDVSFDVDGSGTASGFFQFDPTLGTFGDFSLTTSDGTGINSPNSTYYGYTYNPADSSGSSARDDQFSFVSNTDVNGTFNVLFLDTSSPVGTGGTYALTESAEEIRGGGFFGTVEIYDIRDGASGTLTAAAVPEAGTAASLGLMLAAGGGAVALGRRRRAA